MNLLLLTRYDRQGASSRLRTMQYIPYLEEIGFRVRVESLLDKVYLKEMYEGRKSRRRVLSALTKRMKDLSQSADVIWLEKEALPWLPWGVESLFWPGKTPVISDHDDAIFHRYDQHKSGLVRKLFSDKIDQVMKASHLVTAGNQYLAERAISAGAKRVEIVPTVVNVEAYQKKVNSDAKDLIRIGWIGTPETWSNLAKQFFISLENRLPKHRVRFQIIGARPSYSKNELYEYIPWNEPSEVLLVQSLDIGVMPMPDTPWTRGKCGYKLIQYMACGLPVIASPVGVNSTIVDHGVNGFLAKSIDEWCTAILTLIDDATLRKKMGKLGRSRVENEYSIQVYGPRIAGLFRNTYTDYVKK